MAKHMPYIVFAQCPETYAVHEDVICDTKAEADGEEEEMIAEWSSYAQGGMPEIYVERLNSEKVRRAYGSKEQERMLREFC